MWSDSVEPHGKLRVLLYPTMSYSSFIKPKRKSIHRNIVVLAVGYTCIFALSLVIPDFFRNMFFGGNIFSDPLTFQMAMWFPFLLGVANLLERRSDQLKMLNLLYKEDFLQGDENSILDGRDLANILKGVREKLDESVAVVNRIIHQVALKYQSAQSVEQASTMLGSLLDLTSHRLELAYSFVRYLSWLIPTLGFMGTVYGISLAVSVVGLADAQDPTLLKDIAGSLAIAFNTTLLALVQSSILLLIVHLLETKDELFVNDLGQYVQRKLINRLE